MWRRLIIDRLMSWWFGRTKRWTERQRSHLLNASSARVVDSSTKPYDESILKTQWLRGETPMIELDRVSDPVPPGMGKVVQLLYQLEDQGEPIVISINGKVEITVADDRSFRKLVDLVDELERIESLKQAAKELDEGKGLSLEEVRELFRVKYGISN